MILAPKVATPSSARQLADATRRARWQAKQQLKAYRLQAQIALLEWLASEPGQRRQLDDAALLQWQAHWRNSPEVKRSGDALAARLADYKSAAKRELSRAAEVPGGTQAAIENMLAEVMGRDSDGDWEDEVLDRMLAGWVRLVARAAQGDPG